MNSKGSLVYFIKQPRNTPKDVKAKLKRDERDFIGTKGMNYIIAEIIYLIGRYHRVLKPAHEVLNFRVALDDRGKPERVVTPERHLIHLEQNEGIEVMRIRKTSYRVDSTGRERHVANKT